MEKTTHIELIKKGAVNIYSEHDFDELIASGRELTIKLGADPSRPDLHIGHSVILRKLRLFQELGHKVVFVIGDFTGMIGDPSGKSKTRPSLTLEQTRESGATYYKQVTKILDPEKTSIVYNSEWLGKMNFEDIIKLCSKYTVARIMERDDFKNRFEGNIPISMHELFYPLIQGYDSVALHADIEIGGTDQTFNMLVGRTLQEHYGQPAQVVMTFPLIAGLDGIQKMSKSLDNYIGIDEPADIMFEKCMKVPDHLMLDYFVLTTDFTKTEAKKLISEDIRNAHFVYADTIVTMYHSEHDANIAKKRYLEVARGNTPKNIKTITIPKDKTSIIELVKLAGFATSNSEARRHITGRGIKLDKVTVEDVYLEVEIKDGMILQFGKNKFVEITKLKS